MRIFLTGGTGLVGRHFAERAICDGHQVRALVRVTSAKAHLERLGAELVVGDVADSASLAGAMTGCETVVHCAAQLGGSSATWNMHERTNVRGTHAVVDEAKRAGVEQFVHLSTVAVYGRPDLHDRPIAETAPLGPPGERPSFYERSKRLAEAAVRELDPERIRWVIIRPDIIVGEGDRLFTPRIVRFCRRRIVPIGGRGNVDLPIVYVGSVVEATMGCLASGGPGGRIFNVTDDGVLTFEEMVDIASGEDGTTRVRVPLAGIRLAGRVLNGISRLPGSRLPAGLSGRNLWYMSHSDPYSDEKLRTELGWSPSISTVEGWRRSVAWHDSNPTSR